jgi:glycosyltransferase involved in cell wall biosynthesis
MLVLFNFNDYLGGGETLMVRMAEYLQDRNMDFCLFCLRDSYIQRDLTKKRIRNVITLDNGNEDFYYQDEQKRAHVLSEICNSLPFAIEYSFVTFCMRDLYTITQLSKIKANSKIVHLVLHYQDNLYVAQSLFDKVNKKITGREEYSRNKIIAFNRNLINRLCDANAVIPMSDLMVKFWNSKFHINLSSKNVVALPTYDFPKEKPMVPKNNYKIIFIGRLVDFKLPGLCVMLDFINNHQEYTLTIVGSGEKGFLDKYIAKNNIDLSRIKFIGQIDYSELGEIIKQHSIGYAMGTSVIEICRYGLPAIMALSTPTHKLFKKGICGGLYANCVRGNVGDNLFAGESEDDQPLLEDVMSDLEKNYEQSALACYEYIRRDYDFTQNIEKYIEIIKNAKMADLSDLEIPSSSLLRKYIHSKFRK